MNGIDRRYFVYGFILIAILVLCLAVSLFLEPDRRDAAPEDRDDLDQEAVEPLQANGLWADVTVTLRPSSQGPEPQG